MEKTPLLLLHGALGNQHQFNPLASHLGKFFKIHRLNFEGHGNNEDTDRPFRIEYFVENVLEYMNEQGMQKTDVFGYSMGGYVALYLAKHEPDKINRVSTLGTVVNWTEEKAATETVYLHPDKIEEKVPHFARQLEDRHQSDWKAIVNKTRELLDHLGKNPLLTNEEWRALPHPVRLHIGDRDNTAGIEPTLDVYNRLDHGELVVLPRTPHPIEKVKEEWLSVSLTEFFDVENQVEED